LKRERLESCDVLFCGEVACVVVEEDVACFLHKLGCYSLDMVSDFISSFMSFLSWATKVLILALLWGYSMWNDIFERKSIHNNYQQIYTKWFKEQKCKILMRI
jgi:hypothetical protein